MKTLILMRHSIPERAGKRTEDPSLSEEGIALARSKRPAFQHIHKCFSSPYRRAVETAELIAEHVTVSDRLRERVIGDAQEDFWLKQYQDHDHRNPNGESLNEVRVRMKAELDTILAGMREGETALIVSHATAICSYLLNFCSIEVTDAAEKKRRVTFEGQTVLNGKLEPADYFVIEFENGAAASIRFCG